MVLGLGESEYARIHINIIVFHHCNKVSSTSLIGIIEKSNKVKRVSNENPSEHDESNERMKRKKKIIEPKSMDAIIWIKVMYPNYCQMVVGRCRPHWQPSILY